MGPLPLFLALFGLVAAGSGEQARVERLASARLSQILGGAESVEVRARPNGLAALWGDLAAVEATARGFRLQEPPLFVDPEASHSGKIGRLRIRFEDFELRALPIEALEADIPGCHFDFGLAKRTGELAISKTGVGRGSVRVNEAGLKLYLERRFPELREVSVRLEKHHLWAEGRLRVFGMEKPFALVTQLAIRDGVRLVLDSPKLYFDWRRAEPSLADPLLRMIDPVLDLQKDLGLADSFYLDELEIRGGEVVARGAARVPSRAEPVQAMN